ncbi:histidine kinase dimerization/phospho-acceptor domain-containing protein [Thermocatellispora tengchongensis]|uniref:histidine kinase dimerization/phospho-acceptor domain-containing protein n=1 Tax=Thermocatellispora tengchongensis TaxID=1073253 RepID=UPI00362A2D4A
MSDAREPNLGGPPGGPGGRGEGPGSGRDAARPSFSPPQGPASGPAPGSPHASPRLTQPTHPMIRPHSEGGPRTEHLDAGAPPRKGPPPPTGPPAWDGPPPLVAQPIDRSLLETIKDLPTRLSIRWRMTIAYGAMFFSAGALLLLVMYWIVGWAIDMAWPEIPVNLEVFDPRQAEEIVAWWAGHRDGAIVVARDHMLSRSLLALVGVGLLAVIIGYFVADRALRPVTQMTSTAKKLSESTLAHQRIDLHGPNDELKELADTFDAMLTRLNVAFHTQRRFVANASHELRTPLTINRTVLEIALSDPEASEDPQGAGTYAP